MSTKNSKIKLAIIDDEALLVMLLSDFFSKHEQVEVVTTATDGEQFLSNLNALENKPDVILLDLQMKGMNGLETMAVLKQDYPELKIIVVSSLYKKSFMGYMLKLGVNAFLPKGVEPQLLADAVTETYARGYFFMDEQIEVMRRQISSNVPEPALTTEESLSEREIEVLKLICQQYTAQQIADKLFITKRTVEGHKSSLLLKTSAKNTAGLVIYAVQKKIIDIDDCILP
jgi:DNA-binding NarL/FixJ family response regulator